MELQLVWGWQPALYLFLGGLGAGAFVAAACLYLSGKLKSHRPLAIVSWASLGCLAVGLLLLLSELIFPLRGLMMWQSFSNFTSWMTVGAWLLFTALVFIFLAAVALTDPLAHAVKLAGKDGVLRVFFIVGGVLSLGVCVYTGILLMSAPGVPLWNTLLLPALFTVSALDTGVALNEIVLCATAGVKAKTAGKAKAAKGSGAAAPASAMPAMAMAAADGAAVAVPAAAGGAAAVSAVAPSATAISADSADAANPRLHKLLSVATIVLVVLEAVVVVALLALMGAGGGHAMGSYAQAAAQSAALLTTGPLAGWFWVAFVGLGLVVPLVCAVLPRFAKAVKGHAVTYVGAASVLIGGCVLRFLILLAGIHADVIAIEVAKLVF